MGSEHTRREEGVEGMLDALGAGERTPAAPAAYLAAVGKRRVERRVRWAGIVLGGAVVVVGVAVLLPRSSQTQTAPSRSPLLADGGIGATIGSVDFRRGERPLSAERGAVAPRGTVSPVTAADWRNPRRLEELTGQS